MSDEFWWVLKVGGGCIFEFYLDFTRK